MNCDDQLDLFAAVPEYTPTPAARLAAPTAEPDASIDRAQKAAGEAWNILADAADGSNAQPPGRKDAKTFDVLANLERVRRWNRDIIDHWPAEHASALYDMYQAIVLAALDKSAGTTIFQSTDKPNAKKTAKDAKGAKKKKPSSRS